ncbi:hypothetical protein Tco_0691506 [Tanacetum coccineum]
MELENSQNSCVVNELPMLKLGEYEMWEIRIKQYFQIQDYALWEVIENGNSWVPIPVTAPESGPSTALKMTVPSTAEEKICKKNDVKARSLLLMALPMSITTFNHYSSEDLNVKFLRSLPSEWDTHVVVWMNKPDFDTMGLDDLYNNFKIVEQKIKRSTGAINDEKNLIFLTTTGRSSINNINTIIPEVSTGSQLVHEDLEQLHDDDLEEMDLKWNIALLSMRARKFYQRTGRKIIIDGSNTAGYDNHRQNMVLDLIGVTWQRKKLAKHGFMSIPQNAEVSNDKSCSKSCLQNYEALKKQYDDLLVKLDDTAFKASTYKRGIDDAPIIEDWVSDDKDDVESIPKVEKKTVIPTATKKEFVKPETPVRRSIRQNVNTVKARGFNAVKPSACWVWKPIKPNGASLSNSQLNDKGFVIVDAQGTCLET